MAGTNGKSTTTALLGWILERTGNDPSVLLGASLKNSWGRGGNIRWGNSPWMVFEADESDGGLDLYRPEIGVITNISADHFPLDRLEEIFRRFARGCGRTVLNADCPVSEKLKDTISAPLTFSIDRPSSFRAETIRRGKNACRFRLRGREIFLPLPGIHNVYNALAALAAATLVGADFRDAAVALADFPGLKRRLETVASGEKITVIDDYAHNPAKIAAALRAVRGFGGRILAVWQPHGFAPLRRFLKELADSFRQNLEEGDLLFLLPVYYAGGNG